MPTFLRPFNTPAVPLALVGFSMSGAGMILNPNPVSIKTDSIISGIIRSVFPVVYVSTTVRDTMTQTVAVMQGASS